MDGSASGRMNQGSRTVAAANGSMGNFGLKVSDGRVFSGAGRARRLLEEAMPVDLVGGAREGGDGGGHETRLDESFCRHIGRPAALARAMPSSPLPSARC